MKILTPILKKLLLLVALVACQADAKVFDGNVDSANLGKGDHIYVLSYATNQLGGHVPSVTDVQSLMNYEASQGMQWIVIKASTGSTNYPSNANRQFTYKLVLAGHNAGLKVFAYNRSYGTDTQGEINIANYVFGQGADGLIMDSESEWETSNLSSNLLQATNILGGIKALHPNKFMGHAPFMYINFHSSFPYKQYGLYCDAAMPQDYWYSFGITPSACVTDMDNSWRNWQNGLSGGWTNAIKPIAPIGQADASAIPGSDITSFVNALINDGNPACAGGYKGVSWWRADLHTTAQWTSINSGNIGGPFLPNPPTPAAPSSLSATVVSSSRIDLSWVNNAGTNPCFFVIARGTVAGGPYTDIAATNSTAYSNTGLSGGSTYYYVVRACNPGGQSANSNEASGSTPGIPDIIVDNVAATITGSWSTGTSSTDKYATDYRYKSQGTGAAYVTFTPNITTAGNYTVYEWHPQGSNRTTAAQVTVNYNGGSQLVPINQTGNGGSWRLLGTFNFAAGTSGNVRIADNHPDATQIVMADAVKFTYVAPPVAPTGLNALAGNAQVSLSWDSVVGATSYNVKRSGTGGGPYATIVNTASTSFNDTGLTNGVTVFYVVSAVGSGGEGANSDEVDATPAVNDATAGGRSVPASVNVGATFSASITMTNTGTKSWDDISGHSLGSVSPQDNTTWGFNRVSLPSSPVDPGQSVVFNFTATAPASPGTYNFDWRMVQDGVEWFGQTNAGTIVVNQVAPNAPSGLSATAVGPTQINLAWTDNSGNEVNFVVARSSTTGGPYTDIATVAANATSYNNTGLTANTTYFYVVKATNSAGASAFSNEASATTPNGIPDIIVDNPAATVTGSWTLASSAPDKYGADYRYKGQGTGAAYVTFTPNIVTAGGYAVYEWHPQGANRTSAAPETINYNGGSSTVNVNQIGGGGAWNLVGKFSFAAGTAGYVRIADNIPDAGQVVMADAIKFVYIPAPTAPSGLTATAVSSSQINLAWTDNSTNEDNFIVARSTTAGGPYTDVATVAAGSTSYSNSGLNAGTTYYYVVRARNTTASSANSNEASATTQANTAVHVNSITMSWVASGNKWKARAVVNVKDAAGNNISGATVTGNFTGAFTNNGLSGATDASGNATITSTSSIIHGTVTFTVTNITGTGMTYDSGANVVTSASETR